MHDAELKQGFRVGPEKHYNPPTTVLDESQQLPSWSALRKAALKAPVSGQDKEQEL